MVVPPYSMRQGPFIWDILRLSCSPRCGPNDGPVWTCHWLRKAWSQTSCLTRPMRLLPSLIERNKCLFPVADLWSSAAQSLQPEPLPVRNFCKCHTGPQSAGLPTSTAMSTTFSHFQHTLHSIFVPIPSYSPNIFRVVLAAFSAAVDRHKRKSFDFQILWSFRGVKVQTKAPGGGLIDQHQSRSLASESIISSMSSSMLELARAPRTVCLFYIIYFSTLEHFASGTFSASTGLWELWGQSGQSWLSPIAVRSAQRKCPDGINPFHCHILKEITMPWTVIPLVQDHASWSDPSNFLALLGFLTFHTRTELWNWIVSSMFKLHCTFLLS